MGSAKAHGRLVSLVFLGLVACGERGPCDDPASWEAMASSARALSDERAAQVTLVPAPAGATLEARTPHLARVIVDATRVDLDLTPVAPTAFPAHAGPRERALALPPPIATLYEIEADQLTLPGASGDQHEVLPTIAFRPADLARVELLVEGTVRTSVLAEVLQVLAEAGTEHADVVLDGGSVVPLAVRRLVHEHDAGGLHDPQADDVGLELVLRADHGVTLRGAGGTLAPGCSVVQAADVATLPAQGDGPDTAALSACLVRIVEEQGSVEVVYVEAADATFGAVVPVLAAARAAHVDLVLARYALARPAPAASLADILGGGPVTTDADALLVPAS